MTEEERTPLTPLQIVVTYEIKSSLQRGILIYKNVVLSAVESTDERDVNMTAGHRGTSRRTRVIRKR